MRANTIVTQCPECHGNDDECDECNGTGIVQVCMTCGETLDEDNQCSCEE